LTRVPLPPVLVHRPAFRALWLSRSLSLVGNGATLVALTLLAAARHGPGGVSLLLLALAVPRFLGPVAGTLVDRVEQRRLMRACELGQGLLVAAIAVFTPPFLPLLVLVTAVACLATLFAPAGRSAVPVLVADDERLSANALLGLSLNAQVAIGPALGGILVTTTGTRGALLFDAATFFGSALLLRGLPALHAEAHGGGEAFRSALGAGLRYAKQTAVVRVVVLSVFAVVGVAAIDNVALVFLARDTFGAGSTGYGLLVASFGVGMIVASLTLIAQRRRLSATALMLVGFLATGIGNVATGVAAAIVVAGLAQAVAGMGNAVEVVAVDTLVQERVPRPMLGRVFGLTAMAAYAGQAIALLLAAALLRIASPRVVFIASGVAVLIVTALVGRSLSVHSVERAGQSGA
jgi:MFS family permease